MAEPTPLDRLWLSDHPLVQVPEDVDKNSRGRVLVIGGSERSVGALMLTGEAAFRAGAGKVQLATPRQIAIPLGIAMPEAGIYPLPAGDDGELAPDAWQALEGALESADCVVIGPGMGNSEAAGGLLDRALDAMSKDQVLVLDAAAIHAAASRHAALAASAIPIVVTPHVGEMASLIDCSPEEVTNNPGQALDRTIAAIRATALIKGRTTLIGDQAGTRLRFVGGGPGLATGGSGDVLAGIVAALLSRGQDPLTAAAWATWLHGEAGRRLAERQAPIGYLARVLLPVIPALIRGFA